MGVLVEGITLVVRNATIEQRLTGGLQQFQGLCPKRTFCTDGEICRVGFMASGDAATLLDELAGLGFARPTPEGSPDVAWLTGGAGFTLPCDWLEHGRFDLGDGQSAEMAWIRGTKPTRLVAPPNWKPGAMQLMEASRFAELEFLGSEGTLDVYRHRETGEILYVGRTVEGEAPAHLSREAIGERFSSLANELERLGAFENSPAGEHRGDLATVYERAKKLVEDAGEQEPGPIQLQGLAARLLGRWDEAATMFHRLTELRPDYLDGWLELTMAEMYLRRFEAGERAARRAVELAPDSASTLGNLAAALWQQGKLDEAESVARKAVAADPADAKNRYVLAAVQKAMRKRAPWWKKLLGA